MKSNYTIYYLLSAVSHREAGRRRNSTVEQRIYNLIRDEEFVSKKPYPGCRICKNGKICDPCRLVEAFKLARNHPKVWHDIIYKDEDQTSAASQRRRSKLKKATGSWDDIRWWQHDNKGSYWWDVWRRTYVTLTRIIKDSEGSSAWWKFLSKRHNRGACILSIIE